MRKIREVLEQVTTLELNGISYSSAGLLYELLGEHQGVKIIHEEMSLMPYYIMDEMVYEPYIFELNIRIANRPSLAEYLLARTRKSRIEEINPDTERILTNCYIELLEPASDEFADKLREYLHYLLVGDDFSDNVCNAVGEFDKGKVYLAVL